MNIGFPTPDSGSKIKFLHLHLELVDSWQEFVWTCESITSKVFEDHENTDVLLQYFFVKLMRMFIVTKPPWLSGCVVRHVSTRYCVQTSVSASME